MIRLKNLLPEGIQWKNGGLQGDGWFSSMPTTRDNDAIEFHNDKGDRALAFVKPDGDIYADINNSYDKVFSTGEEFVEWLNKNNYEYTGFDNYFG